MPEKGLCQGDALQECDKYGGRVCWKIILLWTLIWNHMVIFMARYPGQGTNRKRNYDAVRFDV
jgi:hypothetical protein